MSDPHARLLAEFGHGLLDPEVIPAHLFRGDPARIERRFGLYRGNLTGVWDKALGAAYPVLRQLVGDPFFTALARAYGRAYASTSGDVNAFGAALPAFLDDFPHTQDHPYFPALARLEWSVHTAHYATDTAALDPARLAELDPARLDTLMLALRPGARLFQSTWAVGAIWQAHQHDAPGALDGPLDTPSHLLVHRPRWRVEVRTLDRGAFAALSAIDAGQPLGAALETGLIADQHLDPEMLISDWLTLGLFRAPHTSLTEIPS